MRNKVLRSLIAIMLLSMLVISMVGLCACQEDTTQEIPKYETIGAYVHRIYLDGSINWSIENKADVEVVTSLTDLEEKFNILGTDYNDDYFENYVVMLIRFQYESSESNIEFKNLAIKDNKFYPIFAINTALPNQGTNGMRGWYFYVIRVNKLVLEYEFGEILVINRRDLNLGSDKYNSIKTVF